MTTLFFPRCRRILRILAAAFVLQAAAALTAPETARARCCVCDWSDNDAHVANNYLRPLIRRNREFYLRRLDQFEARFLLWFNTWWDLQFHPSLIDMSEHLAIHLIEHAAMIGTLLDARNENSVLLAQRKKQADATHRLRPGTTACAIPSATPHLIRAQAADDAMRTALDRDARARTLNFYRSEAVQSPGARGNETDLLFRWNEFITHFCDPNQNYGADFPAGVACASTLINGDIRAGDVLLYNDTIGDETELRAAAALIRNLAEPFPLAPMADVKLQDQAGLQTFLARRAYYARRQTAHTAFTAAAARRMPGSNARGWAEAVLNQAGLPPAQIPDNPSRFELMAILTKQRFRDPGYFVRLQDEPALAAREYVSLQALDLMQQRDNFEMKELILMLQAARLGLHLDQERGL